MSGIYFHIPFCKQKCIYCNFHLSLNTSNSSQMCNAMLVELENRKIFLNAENNIETIYFGGGTPSFISEKQIEAFLNSCYKNFKISSDVEITIETNPDDLNFEKLKNYKQLSINRLSIGCQSFDEQILKFLGRTHNSHQSIKAVETAQKVGYENISIDLIYGIPNQNTKIWRKNLDVAFNLNVPHISSYALTLEPSTELNFLSKNHKNLIPDSDKAAQEFSIMVEQMSKNNFEHYEISNFAKKNFHSRHNLSYWHSKPYLGIGPSAHSYDGNNLRQWNISKNAPYIEKINSSQVHFENEILSEKDKYNELMMLSFRLKQGIDLRILENKFNPYFLQKFLKTSQKYLNNGQIKKDGYFLSLTQEARFFADSIACDFFIV